MQNVHFPLALSLSLSDGRCVRMNTNTQIHITQAYTSAHIYISQIAEPTQCWQY